MTHRDVKPANLLVQADGTVRVVDFGLARRPELLEERVTATGARVGTPAYMAPEQVEGAAVGPAADVFSLGVVLYRLVAGTHPFARDSEGATALALSAAAHTPLGAAVPEADPGLVAVVERCLARDPAGRYRDGEALAVALASVPAVDPAALAAFVADQDRAAAVLASSAPAVASISVGPVRRRPVGRYAVMVLVIAGAAAWGWFGQDRPAPLPAASPPAPPMRTLPPRPVVAVAGFAAPDDDPDDPRAAVLADALRHALEQAPEALVAVPLAVLEGTLRPDQVVGPDLPPRSLARPGRRLGHVDLVVRGSLREAGEGLALEVELVDTLADEAVRSFTVRAPADPLQAATVLARGLLGVLQVDPPEKFVIPARSASAYGALLASRQALRTGDFEAAERDLGWALQLEPGFVEARLDRLALLRSRRQNIEIEAEATALLAREDLSARERALAVAWQAIGRGDGEAALQALHALLERWPADLAAAELLMVLRAYDPALRDLSALEEVARRVLALAPRHEEAASRLVRALAFRGRVAEAEEVLGGLGIPPEDPGFAEVFGELDLYAGRYDAAARRFAAAVRRSPDNLYAEHMGFAVDILRGRCDEAAVAALRRIQRIEALGREGNLDWTRSLATQALICRGQWEAAEGVMTTWAAASESGRVQVLSLRPRVALVAGEPATGVAARVLELLDDEEAAPARPELLRLLARVGADAEKLRAWGAEAEARAVDAATLGPARGAWLQASKLLIGKADLLGGGDVDAALAALRAQSGGLEGVRDEGDLQRLVEARVIYAEALEAQGRDARPEWAWIAGLGYPRLYATDLWRVARERREQ
ncbi:MAG: serine/threonine-protein kinase [bacterium]